MKLGEHIQANVRHANCEACGTNAWTMYDDATFALVEARSPPGGAPGGIEVAAVVCNSCGYVRLFSAAAIVDFTDGNGQGAA
jgi:ribosomal protein L37E